MAENQHKKKILKEARVLGGKNITFKGPRIRITSHLSSETMQARRDGKKYLKRYKKKKKAYQPRILNPVKLSFKYEEEINIPSEKQKLRQYVTSLPCKKMLKEVIQRERKLCRSEMWSYI